MKTTKPTNTEMLEYTKEVYKHMRNVSILITDFVTKLLQDVKTHDSSKLSDIEANVLAKNQAKLSSITYGSEEYRQALEDMKPALKHHYACNLHHPEHWCNGIEDMSLIDIVEMLCDWKAATLKHDDGDIYESIKINTERFGISKQLSDILWNTAVRLDW